MSTRDAVTALKRLGLPNYQARVFVALQGLGTGTAQEVSEASEVPRSQVYGAADDLVKRGLAEVVESSPKRYRPVTLDAARERLAERLEAEQERAFENLADLRAEEEEPVGEQAVSTLRGRTAIDDRIERLVRAAERQVVFVAPTGRSVSESLEAALRERAEAGLAVTVITADRAGQERFADSGVRVVLMDEGNPGDFAGRALMTDDATVLLSVATDDSVREEAMWTARSSIGRILAQFMRSGIESGTDRAE